MHRRLRKLLGNLVAAVAELTDFGDDAIDRQEARLAARHLLARTPFGEIALSAGNPRIRLLFAGCSETVAEIVVQLLRVAHFEKLGRFRCDIVAKDAAAAREQLIELVPSFIHLTNEAANPPEGVPLSWAGSIVIHEGDPETIGRDQELTHRLEADGAFTAIIVSGNDSGRNMDLALAIRQPTAATDSLAAPIFVRLADGDRVRDWLMRLDGHRPRPQSGLLSEIGGSSNPGLVIEPFGMADEIHDPEFLLGERERWARQLHEAYRARWQAAISAKRRTDRSALPAWEELDEGFKQVNRRAIDMLGAARLEVGLADWWNVGAGLPRWVIDDPIALEKLSIMTHKSWRADRELDGWRLAPARDSSRKLHTDLVDYDALSEDKKELDREQIRLLASLAPEVATGREGVE